MKSESPRSSRAWFKVQYSDFPLLYQSQRALTLARHFSFLKLRQLTEPWPWGPSELDKPLLNLLVMKLFNQCCYQDKKVTLTQSIPQRLASHAVLHSLPSSPAKHLRPLHHAVLETIWHGLFLSCFLPKVPAETALQMCAGQATWISHQGCEVRDFQSFSLLWPSENIFPLAPWAGCLNSTDPSTFQSNFSFLLLPSTKPV